MHDDELLRTLVTEAVAAAVAAEEQRPAPAALPPVRPGTDPTRAALAARVGAWLGTPRVRLPGPPASWSPARDRAGYLAATPARLGVGRAGTRYKTATLLEFRSDHAAARDAVFSALEPELIEGLGLLSARSAAQDRREFLRRPDLGRRLDEESAIRLAREATRRPQVQIVAGDGLSATALRVNLPRLLPPLLATLQAARLKVGRTIYVHNSRVALADQIGRITEAELLCMLVGERPGLKSAESVGAYITYFAGRKLVEAQRSVISNIHDRGIPPEEGASRIAALCLRALSAKGTGIDLSGR